MNRISACIISFNEEKKIARCLESLAPIVDEIVVVDSLSHDTTREIARHFTDRIIEQPFLGYVEQKNFAVQQASHDWILSLDCDEVLSPELQQSLKAIKSTLDSDQVYRVARRTWYINQWLNHCWYPDKKVRLFDRRRARWGGINPHDRVITDGLKIIDLQGDLYHYSFDSISDHLKTIDKFTAIGAQEIIARNQPVHLWDPPLHGLWTFLRLYLLKQGFRDGFAGFLVAFLSMAHAFIKYSRVIMARRDAAR
jgi:glycosyltransferase involved in cell wall biosynthesis